MARLSKITRVLNIFIYFSVFLCCCTDLANANVELDENNWRQILEGEWMVEFYAPWCPACNALAPAWKELSNRAESKNLGVKAAAVDVTKSPGLSGRFVVTALPTIFHVKEGEFRQYKGPRDTDSMIDFVERGRWKQTEAIPSWKSPNSLQMTMVAHFFRLSQGLRGFHNMLMEKYGLPSWGSYLIFAVATIFLGAILGLVLVCILDVLYPGRVDKVVITQAELDKLREGKKSDDEQELINDDIVDDAEQSPDSEAEKNSPSDTSEDDKEKEKKAGGDENKADKQEVRKRRPRKAD